MHSMNDEGTTHAARSPRFVSSGSIGASRPSPTPERSAIYFAINITRVADQAPEVIRQ